MENKKNAILLASGGLDSFVMAHYVKKRLKKKIKILFFDYGQKALREELFCVNKLARQLKAKLMIINLRWLGKISTSFINKNKKTGKDEIIKWYVPCRNSIFLFAALAYAESLFLSKKEKNDIYIGIKYEGELSFKDTTSKFLKKINGFVKNCVQEGRYKILAPFINKDKEEIINLGGKMKINLQDTYSCYIGKGFAKINKRIIPIHCGVCGGCKARKKGFRFSNIKDLSIYKNRKGKGN